MYLAQPSSVSSSRRTGTAGVRMRRRRPEAAGRSRRRRTRSGCSAARISAQPRAVARGHHDGAARRRQRRARPTRRRRTPRRAYAAPVGGRSERPLPRGSNVTTLTWRARYGICAFQSASADRPGRKEEERRRSRRRTPRRRPHAVALDEALRVRVPRAGLLVAATFDGSRSRRLTKSRMSRLHARGPAPAGSARRLEPTSVAARVPGERARRACGAIASQSPWITSIGQRTRLGGGVPRAGAAFRRQHAVPASQPPLQPPADAVLDLLRRVWLGEDLPGEEFDEAGKSRRQ